MGHVMLNMNTFLKIVKFEFYFNLNQVVFLTEINFTKQFSVHPLKIKFITIG